MIKLFSGLIADDSVKAPFLPVSVSIAYGTPMKGRRRDGNNSQEPMLQIISIGLKSTNGM